ncbi:ROK family protein [Branchiibius sp. NY16-3462-2]|uniref:ROK family protein n=1 Tax=Branchiibius sp. NY16-3462-2 TaxID=1807500 RepID=UPI0007956D7A|nr:ROK family protein [Branchiibius sp. NY16-3462-2]KYH43426.1 hypothetical protein AZH51_16870 [Branchiibius sp. NY16-3462-2]
MSTVIRPVARPEQIRKHNLGLLLRHLHQVGSISRSELTTATGLNRSTIAALVGELAEREVVAEHPDPTKSGAGRPSYVVTALPQAAHVIAVDLDVRTVSAAAVGFGGQVRARRTWNHPVKHPEPGDVADAIAQAASELDCEAAGSRCVGLSVGVPGMVRAHDGWVLNAPNLRWHGVPFGQLLRERVGREVRTANDADLAAYAEHLRGAGRGYNNLICVLGRNGVGSGVLVDGIPLHGATGYAGELGHVVMDPKGRRCHCGNRGCVEQYAGAPALLRAARRRGAPVADVDELFSRFDSGDEVAARVVSEVADWVGVVTGNVVTFLEPNAIVYVGHLAEVIRRCESAVARRVARGATADAAAPVALLPGVLDEPILVGAAELAFEDLFAGDLSIL